jgi:hypothetical protein
MWRSGECSAVEMELFAKDGILELDSLYRMSYIYVAIPYYHDSLKTRREALVNMLPMAMSTTHVPLYHQPNRTQMHLLLESVGTRHRTANRSTSSRLQVK